MNKRSLVLAAMISAINVSAGAQEAQQVIGPMMDMMQRMIDHGIQQQEIDRLRNSPEFQNQQIQPGGLTRGQVIIVQQLLLQRGYDIGLPDGIIGPKTMAVVAQLQRKAGTAVTGYPTQELLDALLEAQ